MDNTYKMDIYIYRALNRTPNIDCYWVGAVLRLLLEALERFLSGTAVAPLPDTWLRDDVPGIATHWSSILFGEGLGFRVAPNIE